MNKTIITHTLAAFGAGAALFLADLASISNNPYVQAGCAAGIATLGGLGIGAAKRSAP